MLENLSSANLIALLSIVVTIMLALAGVAGYLVKRIVERGSEKDNASLYLMQLEITKRRVELIGMLREDERPPGVTDQIKQEILRVYGETSPQYPLILTPEIVVVVSAAPRIVRSEGVNELMADLELYLTTDGPRRTFEFDLEVTLTSKLANAVSGDRITDILLLLGDEPEPLTVTPQLVADQKIAFRGVSVSVERGAEVQKLRIVNLRADATGFTKASAGVKASAFKDVQAFVSIRPTPPQTTTVAIHNELVTLAKPRIGTVVELWFPGGSEHDLPPGPRRAKNRSLIAGDLNREVPVDFGVKFIEGFSRAFRTKIEEAGVVERSASSGTRFLARFYDVPEGMTLFVAVQDLSMGSGQGRSSEASCRATLVPDAKPDGSGGSKRVCEERPINMPRTQGGVPLQRVRVLNGNAFAVWEWVSEGPRSIGTTEEVTFGVVVAYQSSAPGVLSVRGSFAPLYAESSERQIPLFVDTSVDPRVAFWIEE